MRECDRHPSESQPGGGVCARCLEERLSWLWRGESFRTESPSQPLASSSDAADPGPADAAARPAASAEAPVGASPSSLASVRKQLQVLGVVSRPAAPAPAAPAPAPAPAPAAGVSPQSANARNGGGVSPAMAANSRDVIEEWAEFQARRRRNGPDGSKSADSLESMEPGSVDATTESPSVERSLSAAERNPELRILMNAQKMRSQSMPLDNRSAEETALRVINEQADTSGYFFEDDLDSFGDLAVAAVAPEESRGDGDGDGGATAAVELQRCFSPVWQSRKSPKWVQLLLSSSSMSSSGSRNRVFPSRSKENDGRKGRYGARSKRAARLDSADWGFGAIRAGPEPEERRCAGAHKSRSVFSWLQDAEALPQLEKHDQRDQLTSSSSSSLTNSVSTDSWLRDLTTVGHLHEIAEELEIVEESSEEEEGIGDVSSFGKFLLLAAQRQPDAHLTRLASADRRHQLPG